MMRPNDPSRTSGSRSQRIVSIAEQILCGQLGLLEGSIQLTQLGQQIDRETNTTCFVSYPEEFNIFAVIASDADSFPMGEWRRHWNPKALAEQDKEKKEHEQFYQEEAYAACQNLMDKYKTESEG